MCGVGGVVWYYWSSPRTGRRYSVLPDELKVFFTPFSGAREEVQRLRPLCLIQGSIQRRVWCRLISSGQKME